MKFQKGQVANPAGRPKGTRNKLCEDFINDLHDLWQKNGVAILERVAADKPEAIVNAATKLMPKDVNHFHKLDEVKNIVESELDRRIAAYLGTPLSGTDGEARALPAPDGARTAH